MKIKKKYRFIEMNISDPAKYTDIAFYVDNTGFIENIEEARNILNLYYNYPLNKQDEKTVDDFIRDKLYRSELRKRYDEEVEKIRKRFSMPPHFRNVIFHSILYGAVYDGSYEKAYLEKKEIAPIQNPNEIPDLQYNIVIHAGTRKEDVKKVFEEFQKEVEVNLLGVKGTDIDKNHPAYHFGYWHDFSLNKPMDVRNQIAPYQTLYRRCKNGETPLDIALDNLHITKEEYNKAKYKIKHRDNKGIDSEYDEFCSANDIIESIVKERDNVKTMINRYKEFVMSPKTIL